MRRGALLVALAAAACRGEEPIDAALRGEAETVLGAYQVALVEAYVQGDAAALAAVATERERARVANQIAAFEADGTALRPALKSSVIETVERAGRTSLAVTTNEVWDLRTVALGSEQAVGEALGQQNRLEYTLIRDQGTWWVLSRILRASSADSGS